jgi:integrase
MGAPMRLKLKYVQKIVDGKAKTPSYAQNWLAILRVLMAFAIEKKIVRAADNPTLGVKSVKFKTDGLRTWTEDHIAAYEAAHPLGTMVRLALALALGTGQRRNDLMRMGPGDIRGDLIAVRQKKTGKRLLIPIGAELRAAIDAMPNAHPVFMWTELGEPRTLGGFSKWFPRMCKAAGLPKGLSVHGLRKATCRRMAEAGCSNAEIKAVTGHETDREVARYTKAADQERLARAAAARVAAARATHTAPPGYTHTPNFPSNIKAAGNVVVLGGRN